MAAIKKTKQPEPPKRRPHRPTGKPRGRPEGQGFHPTDEQRAMVKAAMGYRIAEDEIAKVIINPKRKRPISVTTLRMHFADEIEQGYAHLHTRIMAASVRGALGVVTQDKHGNVTVEKDGNVTMQIWLMKVLYGMREQVDVAPPPSPVMREDGDLVTIEAARRVAFTMALGAHIVADQKHLPKPKSRPPL